MKKTIGFLALGIGILDLFTMIILIMTQSGKLICAETKGEHLKNDDSREKIALGQAWRTAAGKDFRYYMVFENEENLLPGAVSMSQFIDTVKAL